MSSQNWFEEVHPAPEFDNHSCLNMSRIAPYQNPRRFRDGACQNSSDWTFQRLPPLQWGSLLWWRRIDCCHVRLVATISSRCLVLVHLAFLRESITAGATPAFFCGFLHIKAVLVLFHNWGPDLFCLHGHSNIFLGLSESKATRTFCVFSQKFKMNPTKAHFGGTHPWKGQSPLRLLGGSIFLKIGTAAPLDFGSVLHQKDLVWFSCGAGGGSSVFTFCWGPRACSLLCKQNCHQKSGLSCQECGPVTGDHPLSLPLPFPLVCYDWGIWPPAGGRTSCERQPSPKIVCKQFISLTRAMPVDMDSNCSNLESRDVGWWKKGP